MLPKTTLPDVYLFPIKARRGQSRAPPCQQYGGRSSTRRLSCGRGLLSQLSQRPPRSSDRDTCWIGISSTSLAYRKCIRMANFPRSYTPPVMSCPCLCCPCVFDEHVSPNFHAQNLHPKPARYARDPPAGRCSLLLARKAPQAPSRDHTPGAGATHAQIRKLRGARSGRSMRVSAGSTRRRSPLCKVRCVETAHGARPASPGRKGEGPRAARM